MPHHFLNTGIKLITGSRQKNAADLRLQELKTATDLMEPLLSADRRKRQIAVIMLPHTVSDEVMSRQILLIVT